MTLRFKRKRAADEEACAVKKAPIGSERKEEGMGQGGRDGGGREGERERERGKATEKSYRALLFLSLPLPPSPLLFLLPEKIPSSPLLISFFKFFFYELKKKPPLNSGLLLMILYHHKWRLNIHFGQQFVHLMINYGWRLNIHFGQQWRLNIHFGQQFVHLMINYDWRLNIHFGPEMDELLTEVMLRRQRKILACFQRVQPQLAPQVLLPLACPLAPVPLTADCMSLSKTACPY
jgi:hypothetical protein